jgi:hypothetical protein
MVSTVLRNIQSEMFVIRNLSYRSVIHKNVRMMWFVDCFVRIDQTNTDRELFCTATCHTGEPSYLSNWKNEEKHPQHNKKQGPHSLFLQTGNLPNSSCVSIRIFTSTSQIDIEWCRLCCYMDYSKIASWCGFSRIEDHGVTLLTVASGEGIWYQTNISLLFYESQKFT